MEYQLNDVCAVNIAYEDGDGAACDPTGNAVYTVYKDNVVMALTGNLAKINSETGFFGIALDLTAANGFEADADYTVRIAATIDGQSVVRKRDFRIKATPPWDTAAKILANKRVQTKATGAIVIYDDDGVTPLLTLTPTEDASTITVTPS